MLPKRKTQRNRCHVVPLIYLNPGTVVTGEPSFSTHETVGTGLPCAEHDICDPLSLLNVNLDTGSCKNNGAWPLSIIDAIVV